MLMRIPPITRRSDLGDELLATSETDRMRGKEIEPIPIPRWHVARRGIEYLKREMCHKAAVRSYIGDMRPWPCL